MLLMMSIYVDTGRQCIVKILSLQHMTTCEKIGASVILTLDCCMHTPDMFCLERNPTANGHGLDIHNINPKHIFDN